MATTSFTLRGNNIQLIQNGFYSVNTQGKKRAVPLRIGTGIQIDPEHWDQKAHRPTLEFSKKDKFKTYNELESLVEAIQRAFFTAEEKTKESVKDKFLELTGKKQIIEQQEAKLRMVDLFRKWQAEHHHKRTAQEYGYFAKRVETFEKHTGKVVYMQEFTNEDYDSFIDFCKKNLELNDCPAAMLKIQKWTNKAINFCRYNPRNPIKVIASPQKEQKFTPKPKDYLTFEEYAQFLNYTPDGERELQSWLCCLTLAFTGLRISDLWSFIENIERRNGLLVSEFVVTKKPSPTVCPLVLEPLQALFKKYGQPTYRSEQEIRRTLKKILRSLGIDKVITPHSFRRSFITNMLSLGVVPSDLIASVHTGHSRGKADKVFQQYNVGSLLSKAKTLHKILKEVPESETAGIRLLA